MPSSRPFLKQLPARLQGLRRACPGPGAQPIPEEPCHCDGSSGSLVENGSIDVLLKSFDNLELRRARSGAVVS